MTKHVMVIPADRGGCGLYRLVWPAQAVSLHARPDWKISIVPPERIRAGFRGETFLGVSGFPDPLPDLLVMQRVGSASQYHTLRWASEHGVATVVDFDDAMWCIDRENAAWSAWNLNNHFQQHWRWCDDAAAIADLVTTTTAPLSQRYSRRHHRTQIIPNYVPGAALSLPRYDRERDEFVAGWAGYTSTHPKACTVSAPAAQAVLDEGGRLCVIADAPGAAQEWGVPPETVRSIPPQKIGAPYLQSLSALDLMLVGLRDTPFDRAKSTLKALEAAAAGAASIAPDNPPHRALAKSGFPIDLAASAAEWVEHARRHARMSPDQRDEQRAALMSLVHERYTIEQNAEQWAQAWERAMRRAHGAV